MNSEDIRLLQQLLANRHGSLTLTELSARNREDEATLAEHLDGLRENGLVATLGDSGKYYPVTECGIQVLKQIGHYEQIGILHDMYSAAETDVEAGDRPRPEWL